MAIKKKTADGWDTVAGAVSCPYAIGQVIDTLNTSETISTLHDKFGGTWEAIEDRVEDAWKEYPCTYTNTYGNISNFKLRAKVSNDKAFVDIDISFNISANGVSSTSAEAEMANSFKMNGTLFNACGIDTLPFAYCDGTNESQTAAFYFSPGSNKIWGGFNRTGNFGGVCIGRKVIPYNSKFTPDKTFKRFKRTA